MAQTRLVINPLKNLPKTYTFSKQTLLGKFVGVFFLLFGRQTEKTKTKEFELIKGGLKTKTKKFNLGISGWILLILGSPLLLLVPPLIPLAAVLSPVMPALAALGMGLYFIFNTIVTAALMIVAAPFIVVAHAIWGPEEKKTPVRRSFFLNPLTYVMAALLAGLSFFLIQHLNPALFINAAAPLMIVQTVLMSMAALAVVAGILYAGYRIGLAVYSRKAKPNYVSLDDLDTAFQESDQAVVKKGKQVEDQNYITKYLNEHLEWAKVNWGKAIFFYGLMLVGVGAVSLLVANYFTAGLLFGPGTEGFMKLVFDFMVSGFTSALQSMAGLQGLDFLAASDATLMLIGQILTVFTLITAAIVIPYTGARLCQTGQEEFSSVPEQDIQDVKAHYAQLVSGNPRPTLKQQSELKDLYKVRALYDLIEAQAGDLTIFTGEELTVLDDQDDTWWAARNANGKVGEVPKAYVEKIVTSAPSYTPPVFTANTKSASDEQQNGLYQVRAMHDYVVDFDDPEKANDLPLIANEILTVLDDQEDPYWWKARNAQGKVGFIPSNYVEVIKSVVQLN